VATALWLLVAIRRKPIPSRGAVVAALALGAGYSVNALCFAASLKRIQAELADVLVFTYPALVTVGAAALGRERWSRRRGAALAAASGGIALAAADGSVNNASVALALAAALVYA